MPSASIAFFLSTLENFEAATDFHSPITAFVSTFVSMPPRSVLLNVSITSKLEKDSVVESVKEIAAQTEPRQDSYEDATVVMEEGKHERADSAVSGRLFLMFLRLFYPVDEGTAQHNASRNTFKVVCTPHKGQHTMLPPLDTAVPASSLHFGFRLDGVA